MFPGTCELASESGYFRTAVQLKESDNYEVLISPGSLPVKEGVCFDLALVIDLPQTNAHLMLIFTFWILQQVVGVLLEEEILDRFFVGIQQPVVLGHAALTLPAYVFAAIPAGKRILPVSNVMLFEFEVAILNVVDFVKLPDWMRFTLMDEVMQVHKRVSLVAFHHTRVHFALQTDTEFAIKADTFVAGKLCLFAKDALCQYLHFVLFLEWMTVEAPQFWLLKTHIAHHVIAVFAFTRVKQPILLVLF